MKKNLNLIIFSVVFILILAMQSFYIVQQAEQAIVLQFGNPVRVIKDAGLKIKAPFIQNVVFYDKRLLNLEPPAQEVVLKDKKRWTIILYPILANILSFILGLYIFSFI